eukprot:TRINITY_DN19270_c0_g1_i2.p1 TRINITY_DN19270_c0_g1~~TRINITY_DN19270_c0_g1_i2.p1  ORF type:complete len:312 (+),score=45.35 TRINITY_DN19270_c0_g1_i2:93-1028(+)
MELRAVGEPWLSSSFLADSRRQCQTKYTFDDKTFQGHGFFSKVRRGRHRSTGEAIVMMSIKTSVYCLDGRIPIWEMAVLQQLRHEHVTRLLDVFCKPGQFGLVFQSTECNLRQHMEGLHYQLTPAAVKDFTQQLLLGLKCCHKNGLVHRNLNPQALFIAKDCVLKVGAFSFTSGHPLPEKCNDGSTMWYMAPEVLLGVKECTSAGDMWAAACIMAEMATGAPLFMGLSAPDTALTIFEKLGAPPACLEMGVGQLPDMVHPRPAWRRKGWENIRNMVEQVGDAGTQLLDKLFLYEPAARPSASRALLHQYLA